MMKNKVQKGSLILLFLLSPLLGLVSLFKTKNEKLITFFGTLFFVLLGSMFVYVDETDGYTHLQNAKEYYSAMSMADFFHKAYEILTFNSTIGATDIYLHCISFISASLLQIPEFIHVFAGFVLGYFFTKSVLLVLKGNLFEKKGNILIAFITLFLLMKSAGALNSIRMWTGMWILFYGTYSLAITKNKKYFFTILLAVVVHFSYSVILIPVIVAFLFRKWKRILVAIYVTSFFTSTSFSFFSEYVPQTDLFEYKQKYTVVDSDEKADLFEESAQVAEKEAASLNFYKVYGEVNYLNYSIVGLSFMLVIFYLSKRSDFKLNFLVATGIGLYSFANIVAFSPSLQGRTKMIAATFILAAAIHLQLTLKNYRLDLTTLKRLNTGLIIFLISAIPAFLFQVSDLLNSISCFLLALPQLSWILGDQDVSIRNAIGLFLGY